MRYVRPHTSRVTTATPDQKRAGRFISVLAVVDPTAQRCVPERLGRSELVAPVPALTTVRPDPDASGPRSAVDRSSSSTSSYAPTVTGTPSVRAAFPLI